MAELRVKSTGTIKLFENDNTSSVTIASPASLSANKTVTLPDADVTLASGTMNDATNLSGNIPVTNLNSGTAASSSTFWRGDATWVAPSGGAALTGSTDNTVTTVTGADAIQGEANLTFDGTDLTVSTGNVVIGTAGKGIDFSAQTSAAGMETEILNHYETGTWTGSIITGYGSVTTSATINTLWYTKIGKMVHVQGGCNVSAISSPNGYLSIEGMPYAAGGSGATSEYGYSAMGCRVDNFDSMESMQAQVVHNGDKVRFEQFAGGQATHPGNLVTATTTLRIGGTYMAAS